MAKTIATIRLHKWLLTWEITIGQNLFLAIENNLITTNGYFSLAR